MLTDGSFSAPTDITAVIRSAGERTKELCYQILCAQMPPPNIIIINEQPFTKALQRSFEIGIELGRQWTLCIDADMLLRQNGVKTLLGWAEGANGMTFQVQGNLLDKMLCGPRKAGPRLYRSSLLRPALKCISLDGMSVRPEAFVADQMTSLGYPSIHNNLTIGLHDFEQYYRDVYRKAVLHAHKHSAHLQYAGPLWHCLASRDSDYEVALWGLRDAEQCQGINSLDARYFPANLDPLLITRGWREKHELEHPAMAKWNTDQVMIEYGRMRAAAAQR
jgi:hypothetical protein